MKSQFLITFGCSWTWGVGVGYTTGMPEREYKSLAWNRELADALSFRGLLSKKYNFKNINFSQGGSSNQKQFRKAKLFFNSELFRQIQKDASDIIVLWGITATSRAEYFSLQEKKLVQNFLSHGNQYAKFILSNCYDHDHEVFSLAVDMLHWNSFFNNLGIKNFWFDTFNHHNYQNNNPSLQYFEKEYQAVAGPEWPSWQDYLDKKFDLTSSIGLEATDMTSFEFPEYLMTETINNFAVDDTYRDLASQLAKRFNFTGIDKEYHHSDWVAENDKIKFLTEQKLLNPHTYHPTKQAHELLADLFSHIFERN